MIASWIVISIFFVQNSNQHPSGSKSLTPESLTPLELLLADLGTKPLGPLPIDERDDMIYKSGSKGVDCIRTDQKSKFSWNCQLEFSMEELPEVHKINENKLHFASGPRGIECIGSGNKLNLNNVKWICNINYRIQSGIMGSLNSIVSGQDANNNDFKERNVQGQGRDIFGYLEGMCKLCPKVCESIKGPGEPNVQGQDQDLCKLCPKLGCISIKGPDGEIIDIIEKVM